MHLCGVDYKRFSPHCCKCNSFGCTAAIKCGYACHGLPSDSLYLGSEHSQFNSPRLVIREAGFPNPRRALIGSNQLWRVNDSPYYRELIVLTMKCFGYKIPSRVIFTIVGRGRWWNVPNRNFYNSTTRHLLRRVCPQQKNQRLYCSMLWDLILWIPITKKTSPSHWIKLSCLPASFSMWYYKF